MVDGLHGRRHGRHGRRRRGSDLPLLREALRLVDPALPCRGPAIHQQDGWRYENHGGDEAGAVQGYEWIEREGVACYGLAYHGGRIE